jgi:hypothetical protein
MLPRQVCDEGGRPGLTTIIRIRFFKMVGVRFDVGPDRFNEDRSVLEVILRVELSAPVRKRADQGCGHDPCLAISKGLTPLARRGVIEKQRQAFPVTFGAVGLDLF